MGGLPVMLINELPGGAMSAMMLEPYKGSAHDPQRTT